MFHFFGTEVESPAHGVLRGVSSPGNPECPSAAAAGLGDSSTAQSFVLKLTLLALPSSN